MFERYLERLIKQKLGKFIEGLDQNQFKFGVSQANLCLDNLKIKQDALIKLNLPISIELGLIKRLEIKIPWLQLGSSPVELTLDGLNLIVSLQKKTDWQVIDIFDQEFIEASLMKMVNEITQQLSKSDNSGYFEKLAMKIVDNIQVKINQVHIRLEHYQGDNSSTFGATLQSLDINTTNENWYSQYVDRNKVTTNLFKLLKVQALCIYVNPNDSFIIHQQTNNIDHRIEMLESLNNQGNYQNNNQLLQPMNFQVNLEYCIKGTFMMDISLNLEKFALEIQKNQLRCIIKFYELVNEYHKFQNSLARFGSLKEFVVPKQQLNQCENDFKLLFTEFIKQDKKKKWSINDQQLFRHILLIVDDKTIFSWVKDILTVNNTKKTQKNTQTFSQWLFSEAQEKDENLLLKEEIDELQKEVDLETPGSAKLNNFSFNAIVQQSQIVIGELSNANVFEGVSLFLKETMVAFKAPNYYELNFEMEISINDIGVNLFTMNLDNQGLMEEEAVIMSNKKLIIGNNEELWNLRVRKRPNDLRDIEFDVEMSATPLIVIYNKEFYRRVLQMQNIQVKKETHDAAFETIEEWREATQNQLQYIIYKKANRFRINIASPVIVLPFTGSCEDQSPCWVIRLGDLQILSIEQPQATSVIEFEKYQIAVDAVRFQYYATYQNWYNNVTHLSNFREKSQIQYRNKQIFTVIEEFGVKFQISIKRKRAGQLILSQDLLVEHQQKPKVILQGSTSDIIINFTPYLYNSLVNVDHLFQFKEKIQIDQHIQQDTIQNKEQADKIAKRLIQQKLVDQTNLNKNQNANKLAARKRTNLQQVVFEIIIEIPKFKVLLIQQNFDFEDWIMLSFNEMIFHHTKRRTDSTLSINVKDIQLTDLTVPVNSSLISQMGSNLESQNYALQINIQIYDKQSPNYQNIEKQADIILSHIEAKFQPATINDILKFFRNTKDHALIQSLINKSNMSANSSKNYNQDHKLEFDQNINEQKENCSNHQETKLRICCKIINIRMILLHQNYHMDLYRLDSNEVNIQYNDFFDHFHFYTNIKDIILYDLTGYPQTLDPKNFITNPTKYQFKRQEIISIQSQETDGLQFFFEAYDSKYCSLKKKDVDSKLIMTVSSLKLNYIQEPVMRFYSYFFDQFLFSLIQSDPYVDPKQELELQKKRQTVKQDFLKNLSDYQQITEIIDMDITINNINITLCDRSHTNQFISINSDQLTVKQTQEKRLKRIHNKPQQPLLVNAFKIDIMNLIIRYGFDKDICKNPFNIKMSFEQLADSPLLQKIDLHAIDQSTVIDLEFSPFILIMPQDIYTFILKVLDLNINYQDKYQKDYYFNNFIDIEDFYKILSDVVNMRINLNFKQLSIMMLHLDGTNLAEIQLNNLAISIVKYMDYASKMSIKCQQIYILEQEKVLNKKYRTELIQKLTSNEQLLCKEIVISPFNSPQFIFTQQNELIQDNKQNTKKKQNQVIAQIDLMPNGDKFIQIDMSGLKIIIKPHILLMIYYFFLNAFPEYNEEDADKPSYYNNDPENAPKMNFSIIIKESLICFQNKPGLKTIACQGLVMFEFRRENVKDKKLKYEQENDERTMSFNSQQSGQVSKQINKDAKKIWYMRVKIKELHPYACSQNQLDGQKEFFKVKKRQLFTPFEIDYETHFDLVKEIVSRYVSGVSVKQEIFGVSGKSKLFIDRTKMKISIQDMHLIFQICSYASQNFVQEYVKKLERIEAYVKQAQNQNISTNSFPKSPKIASLLSKINSSSKIKLKDNGDNSNANVSKFESNQDIKETFDQLFETLQQNCDQSMASQVSRLRNTTLAFSKIADKYTSTNQMKLRNMTKVSQNNLVFRQNNEEYKDLSQQYQPDTSLAQKIKLGTKNLDVPSQKARKTSQSIRKKTNLGIVSETEENASANKVSIQDPQSDDEYSDAKSEFFYSMHDRGDTIYQSKSRKVSELYDITRQQRQSQMKSRKMSKQIIPNIIDPQTQIRNKAPIYTVFDNVIKNKFKVKSQGFAILFINDFDQEFCPVLDMDIPDITYTQEDRSETSITDLVIQKAKIFYFNAPLGEWEPLLESFQMNMSINQVKLQKFVQVQFPKPIIINITESFLQNAIYTYNAWMQTPSFQLDEENLKSKNDLSRHSQDNSIDKSQSGSINNDNSPLYVNKDDNENLQIDDNDEENNEIDKVTPYSIKNLTQFKFEVIGGGIQIMDQDIQFDQNQQFSNEDNSLRISEYQKQSKTYKLKPGQEIEYAVEYEQLARFILDGQKKKKQNPDLMNTSYHAAFDGRRELKKKNQEIVAIVFEDYEPISNVDLNKIQSEVTLLRPFMTRNNSDYEDSPLITDKHHRNKQKKETELDQILLKQLIYGVTMSKIRKTLTIRTPFVVFNNTLYEYIIKITDRQNNEIKDQLVLRPFQKYAIDFSFYEQSNIYFKMKSSKTKYEDNDILGENQGYSQAAFVEKLLQLNLDAGFMLNHGNGKFTYIKKQATDLKSAYDITLLPPVVIKNALPIFIEVTGKQTVNRRSPEIESQAFQLEKGEEKHFHLFNYSGENQNEIHIKFRISGFMWTSLKYKLLNNSETEEKEVSISDNNGNNLEMCVRLSNKKAGLQLTFYVNTCITNHSEQRITLLYDNISKSQIAGQDPRKDFCLANKDQSILACISGRYFADKALKIRNTGIKDDFYILAPNNKIQGAQKRCEFVYNNYLSLAVEEDYIYTKIVQISPKYIIVNKMKTSICISQEGCESEFFEVLDNNVRQEWVWPNDDLEKLIVIKKPNYKNEDMFDSNAQRSLENMDESLKFKAWKWSNSFPINEIGQLSVQLSKESDKKHQNKGKKIVRIIKKQIEATIFVILEDEDQEHPYYKIENATDNVTIQYVQCEQESKQDGILVYPKSNVPFAFVDPKKPHILTCTITVNKKIAETNPHEEEKQSLNNNYQNSIMREYNIELIDDKYQVEYQSNDNEQKMHILYVSIYTDGFTKILRFSNKALIEERQNRNEINIGQSEIQRMNLTVQMELNELGISIVGNVFKKLKTGQIIKKRKEIAFLTITDFAFNSFRSPQWQQTDFKIRQIQIDNQSNNNALFPTILQPRIFKQLTGRGQQGSQQIIEANIFLNVEKPHVVFIDEMDVTLQGIVIKCDDEFMGYALTFIYDVLQMLKTNLTGIHPLFQRPLQDQQDSNDNSDEKVSFYANKDKMFSQDDNINIYRRLTPNFKGLDGVISSPNRRIQSIKVRKVTDYSSNTDAKQEIDQKFQSWRTQKIDIKQKNIYINNCKFSAVEIEISFLARKKFQMGEKAETQQLKSIMNSSGLALINIDEAPIYLKAYKIHQAFGGKDDITNLIIDHYNQGFKKNIIKLIGSSNFLGNPRKFARTIGTGFQDLINKPREGFQTSTLNGVKGIFQGSGSLVLNTVEGTFGSVQSLTESFSKLILLVNKDKDFLSKREEKLLTEKPKNFVEGIGFGCNTALSSVGSGITGIVVRPFQEGKKKGARGVAIGIYSGVSGLVLKPLSGGLDLVAKSAEGIKNTAKIFEAKVFNDRKRFPRTFYGADRKIKPYSIPDAYIINRILNTVKDGFFKKNQYLETIKFEENDRSLFLIHTVEHIILLEAAQKCVWWHIPSSWVISVTKVQNGLILHLRNKFEGKSQVSILITDTRVINKVHDKMKSIAQDNQ